MSVTKLTNLVNPQVMADIIEKKYVDYMKFAPLATIDNTLEGRPGDTITLPSFSYIGDAATLGEGVELTPDLLTASVVTAKVHKIAKGVELTDEALLSGYGDPYGEAANQIALSIASQEDNEMLATMASDISLVYETANDPNDTDITGALELFGEDIDGTKVALVSPAVYTKMRENTYSWIPASELAANIAIRGVVGEYQGCQVIVTNKLKTPKTIYIVKPGALRIFVKRGTVVET